MSDELWCASCRMEGTRVAAIVKIRGVPFCRPCRESYSGEAEVLAKVVEWHHQHPVVDSPPIERFREADLGAVVPVAPLSLPVKHKCICACGGDAPEGESLIPGHVAKVLPPATASIPQRFRPCYLQKAAAVRLSSPDDTLEDLEDKDWRRPKEIEEKEPAQDPEPVEQPERELEDVLNEVEEEEGMKQDHQDPLLMVLPDLSKALKMYLAGKNVREISATLHIPAFRFHTSSAWRAARDQAVVAVDAAKTKRKYTRKAKKEEPAPTALAVATPVSGSEFKMTAERLKADLLDKRDKIDKAIAGLDALASLYL
jgi:hypothetical protein